MPKAPFPTPGGKQNQARWLADIADSTPHRDYVELCCGAASVLLAKRPVGLETLSDAEPCIAHTLRTIRDRPDWLAVTVAGMVHDRALYRRARHHLGGADPGGCNPDGIPPWELAAWHLYAACHTVSGNVFDSHGAPLDEIKMNAWARKPALIPGVSARLQGVNIQTMDALELAAECDRPGILVYGDVPYRGTEARYRPSKRGFPHAELAAILTASRAKVMVSHYLDPYYAELYPGWRVETRPTRQSCVGHTRTSKAGGAVPKVEAVYLNF